jgi:hypothetical protein
MMQSSADASVGIDTGSVAVALCLDTRGDFDMLE